MRGADHENFRTPLPEDIANFRPEEASNLDRDWFLMTLHKARKGAAGPSGMTAGALEGSLPQRKRQQSSSSQGQLQGYEVGTDDIVPKALTLRRLVAKTLAQELSQPTGSRHSSFPVGAHKPDQAFMEADPSTTVLSVLQGLKDAPGCERASFLSPVLWRMIARWSTRSRRERAESMATRQRLHCTLWVNTGSSLLHKPLCSPLLRGRHLGGGTPSLHRGNLRRVKILWVHAGIRINLGKTQLFKREGFLPFGCQHTLQGREITPPVIVWRGDHMFPHHQQGIFGDPLGHEEFVKSQLHARSKIRASSCNASKPCQTFNARG